MNLFRLSLANLAMSALSSVVNVLLLGLGTARIAILLIATHQLTTTLTRNSAGIDLVIGAQGSPLQLVLAGVYHADKPPGNIPLESAKHWMQHSMIEEATPLALGDTFQGYRIVGSEKKYIDIYGGIIDSGQLWAVPMQKHVVGSDVAANTALEIGSTISGAHGLDGDGYAHEDNLFVVVGILTKTGTVQDRLLVTSMQSVWLVHGAGHDYHEFR
ncbi:MAG: putative ABC transport system permease protein [Candidatus Azotimanducaceae bacterium]|jgi:putative ABC transport system permease protein